ncbi:hypothetical protein PIB30_043978 [Stylosanthes scabra]|uniref:Uncharacterized protein n=1 Tax=Stylosanthes scabra TaxID=79078 RepID=A0ABU6SFL1_9FABA|nr:hypothetical protein [Stylosanthes scabra]
MAQLLGNLVTAGLTWIVPVTAGYSWEPGDESRTPSNTCSNPARDKVLSDYNDERIPTRAGPMTEEVLSTTTTKASPLERACQLFMNSLQKDCVIDDCGFGDLETSSDGRYSSRSFVEVASGRILGLPEEKHKYERVWSGRIPPRYELLTWFIMNNRLSIKDKLLKGRIT